MLGMKLINIYLFCIYHHAITSLIPEYFINNVNQIHIRFINIVIFLKEKE